MNEGPLTEAEIESVRCRVAVYLVDGCAPNNLTQRLLATIDVLRRRLEEVERQHGVEILRLATLPNDTPVVTHSSTGGEWSHQLDDALEVVALLEEMPGGLVVRRRSDLYPIDSTKHYKYYWTGPTTRAVRVGDSQDRASETDTDHARVI